MTRSNRRLTQFAVDKLQQYLVGGPCNFEDEEAGNTKVYFKSCESCPRSALYFELFGENILTVVASPLNRRVISGVMVRTGNFYDQKGNPSRTTRERLNGLLDSLGQAGMFPEGIRVFMKDDQCCIGKGDVCKPLDKVHPAVVMLAHPSDIVFS